MTLKDVFSLEEAINENFCNSEITINCITDVDTRKLNADFSLNSLYRKKVNLYNEFIQKNFFDILKEFYPYEFYNPALAIDFNFDNTKKVIKFSFYDIVQNYLFVNTHAVNFDKSFVEFCHKNPENTTEEEIIESISQYLKEEISRLNDLEAKGKDSLYYETAIEYYKKNYSLIDFNTYLNIVRKRASVSLANVKSLRRILDKEFTLEEIEAIIPYDNLCLAIAYNILNGIKINYEYDPKIIQYLHYVDKYIKAVNVLKASKRKYKPSCAIYNESGKVRNLEFSELVRQYNLFLESHPEIEVIDINNKKEEFHRLLRRYGYDDENFNFFSRDNIILINNLQKRLKEEQELFTKFNIFPHGHREMVNISESKDNIQSRKKDEDNYALKRQDCRDFLESTPYLYKIYGTDKFTGFHGLIYANKVVIFEYLNEEKREQYVATYVVDLNSFLDVCHLDRQQIIKLIKENPNFPVRRVYHSTVEAWQNRVLALINGDDYTEEVIDYINDLIKEDKLTKQR